MRAALLCLIKQIHLNFNPLAETWRVNCSITLTLSLLEHCNIRIFKHLNIAAGIILAAGESTRFGSPKQLLDWKGKPFVRQVAETALQAGLWPVEVVTGFHAADIESALSGLPVNIVHNPELSTGSKHIHLRRDHCIANKCGRSCFPACRPAANSRGSDPRTG